MPVLEIKLTAGPERKRAPEAVVFDASIVNPADEPVPFNRLQAEHPSLVLEVEGPSGTRVLLPPPAPPTEAELAPGELAPGDAIVLRYQNFLDPLLGPGRFRVRYVGRVPALGGTPEDPLLSDWVDFELPRPVPFPKPKPWPFPWPLPWRELLWWLRRWLEIFPWWRCRRTWEQEVDEAVTETISNAPPASAGWNGTYGWRARFRLTVTQRPCLALVTVRVRVTGSITAAQLAAWETAIEASWNSLFKLCLASRCCSDGTPIRCDIQFVSSGEHQVVAAGASTTDMGNWGAADTADVDHEFGHMLGALDEYFTVNGTNWGAARQATGSIMNNPANPPEARHYELIRARAQALTGSAATTTAQANPC